MTMEVIVHGTPAKEKEGKREPDQWEIDSWCRTLMEAEEIKADPEKMKHVKPVLEKKVAAIAKLDIKSVDDLRAVAARKKSER